MLDLRAAEPTLPEVAESAPPAQAAPAVTVDTLSIESLVTDALLSHLTAGVTDALEDERNWLKTLAHRVERASLLVSALRLADSGGALARGEAHRLLVQTAMDLRIRAATLGSVDA